MKGQTTKPANSRRVQPVPNECAGETEKPLMSARFARSLYSAMSHLSCHSVGVAKWETPRFQKLDIPARARPITTRREEIEYQVAYWRKWLTDSGQPLGGVESFNGEWGQKSERISTGEILRSAPATVCVDRLLGIGWASAVAAWDAAERGDVDHAWLNLISAHHTEGLIQGIMIVAENATLSGSLQRKKTSAKSKADYDRLLARAREVKAQKPKFSRPQIAKLLSMYDADRKAKATGGEFDLQQTTILKRLQGLALTDK